RESNRPLAGDVCLWQCARVSYRRGQARRRAGVCELCDGGVCRRVSRGTLRTSTAICSGAQRSGGTGLSLGAAEPSANDALGRDSLVAFHHRPGIRVLFARKASGSGEEKGEKRGEKGQ